MIVKAYGATLHSVEPNFDSRAMNEVGFRRDNEWSMAQDEFLAAFEKMESHELTAVAEGDVQGEAEAELLSSLRDQLLATADSAGDGVVMIESEQGVDYPKTRHTQTTQLVGGANRLHFRFTIEPPLRVSVYRRR